MSDHVTSIESMVTLPFSGEINVSITVPKQRPLTSQVNKIPISVYVSSQGTHNPIGCYIYSLPNHSKDVYSTILNNANETLLDITIKVSTVVSKKYFSPSYVNINGFFGIEEFTPIVSSIIEQIENVYS